MKVSLINYTPNADRLLVFSRHTRLDMTPDSFDEVMKMSQEQIDKELSAVFGTIASSWEFVNYVFLITDVTRAFTHQFVRHRHGSYAQQSMRTVNMSEVFDYVSTGKCKDDSEISIAYAKGMQDIKDSYIAMIKKGAKVEDARGILPTNITTNIMAMFNLRSLSEIIGERQCIRVQGEFREVVDKMKQEVVAVHPWTEEVFEPTCVRTGFCHFFNFNDCPMKTNGYIKTAPAERDNIKYRKGGWEKLMC